MTTVETMPADHAEWVREHVWPKGMRKTFAEIPGFYLSCACEFGMTHRCQIGKHDKCNAARPLYRPDSTILRPGGIYPAMFKTPYFHRTPTATGGRRDHAAQVWLADRRCRWLCPCSCHGQTAERIHRPVQLDLFPIA